MTRLGACRLLAAYLPVVFRIPDCKTAPDDAKHWQLRGHVPDAATVAAGQASLARLAELVAAAHHLNLHSAELVPSYFVLLLQVRSSPD